MPGNAKSEGDPRTHSLTAVDSSQARNCTATWARSPGKLVRLAPSPNRRSPGRPPSAVLPRRCLGSRPPQSQEKRLSSDSLRAAYRITRFSSPPGPDGHLFVTDRSLTARIFLRQREDEDARRVRQLEFRCLPLIGV